MSGSYGEGLETERRRTLFGHERGNPGNRQGQSYTALPRQSLTRQVFLEDWKLNEGWGQLAKQPGEEGSSHSLTLSLLLDHALLLHPEQTTRLNNQAPACTVGSLRQHCKREAFVDVVRRLLAADDPAEPFAQFAEKVKTWFPLAPSSKHMSGRDLGRQEPTPTLRYRAAEVCACSD